MSPLRPRRTETLIIGSGPGGAVTGAVLAEAGRDVLMLEEGADLALHAAAPFSCDEMLLKYRNAGVSVALGNSKLAWVEGRCVGGGSEINRGLYHRTPEYILEEWTRRFQVKDLQSAVMRPHFEACETVARVEYAHHRAPEISRRLQSGAEVHGWHAGEAPRLYTYSPEEALRSSAPPGGKQSMSATFVPRFRQAGGQLLSSTRVRRLRREGSFWIAETEQRGADGGCHRSEVRADRIVVACGAVQTPALLRRSGMTRNIGNTLRFHPMVKVVADFGEMVNRAGDYDPVHQIREFEPQIGMGCSISTPAQLGMALAGQKDAWSLVREHWQNMGLYYVQSSGGSARVRNVRGFVDPMVRVRFEEDDLALLAVNLARLATALFAAGARRIYPCIPGYPVLESRADIASLPARLRPADGSLTSVHVFSSCPMGEDERVCAVNSFGAMFGTEGLYINDASLLCTPTGVNPQGTVMAVARRNAIAMLERRSR